MKNLNDKGIALGIYVIIFWYLMKPPSQICDATMLNQLLKADIGIILFAVLILCA